MGRLPPGCTQSECDQAQPGYYDDDTNPDELEEVCAHCGAHESDNRCCFYCKAD